MSIKPVTTISTTENSAKIKTFQSAFTLLELIIVAMTISVITALALPAYQNYILKAQISEAFTLTAQARQSISDYYGYTGSFPSNNIASGLPWSGDILGKYIQTVTVEDGAIHIMYSYNQRQLAGEMLTLRPVYIARTPTAPIHFICGYAEPTDEQQVVAGENKTSIDEYLLPSACRN